MCLRGGGRGGKHSLRPGCLHATDHPAIKDHAAQCLQELDVSHTPSFGPEMADKLSDALQPRHRLALKSLKLSGCPIGVRCVLAFLQCMAQPPVMDQWCVMCQFEHVSVQAAVRTSLLERCAP
jgi:hypothetical protein